LQLRMERMTAKRQKLVETNCPYRTGSA